MKRGFEGPDSNGNADLLVRSEDKVGCAFPMVISSDLRMGKHRDDDHEEDAPYFKCDL